jgi:hypothetical protein
MNDMAGDWIKVQHVTPDKPEVWQIADRLGIDPDAVVGKLIRVWIWADQQTTGGTCNAPSVTKALLDRVAGVTQFCAAMIDAGWLEETETGIEFRNFDRHNGTSAKKRAQGSNRAAASRNRNANVTHEALQKRYQRREEKRRDNIGDASASCVEPAKQAATPAARKPAWLICEDIAEAYCTFQTNGTVKEWLLPYSKLDEWRRAFPGVNVEQEVNRARQWLIDNRDRRKTCSGMLKFLNTWLTKAQNDGRTAGIRSGGRGQAVGRAEQRERRHAAAFRQVFGDDDTAEESGPGTCQIVQRKIGDGTDTARGAHVDGSIDDLPF